MSAVQHPRPPDPAATLRDTIAAGYTHLEVRCRAPLPEKGNCRSVVAIPFAMLPDRLTALNYPLNVFEHRLKCQACGTKGWVTLRAWRQYEGLLAPGQRLKAMECQTTD